MTPHFALDNSACYQRLHAATRLAGVLVIVVLGLCGVGRQAWGLGMETHGNEPIALNTFSELNPVANHDSRVYAYWVNGQRGLFYRGDADELNEVLAAFAAAPLERHVVVLRPGPCTTNDFDANAIAYDWHLDIVGGIASHQTTLDKGELVWPKWPVLRVCVDEERLKLADIVVPEGIELLQISDLREQYLDALASRETAVRSGSVSRLSRLDPFDAEDARVIARMLKDKFDGVRLSTAYAIAQYGATAKPLLPTLRELHDNETSTRIRTRLADSIMQIEAAQADPQGAARQLSLIEAISRFVRSHSRSTPN
jgi:hypothetical protein